MTGKGARLATSNGRRMRASITRLEQQPFDFTPERRLPRPGPTMMLAVTSSAISARSGATPGSGTVKLVSYDGTALSSGTDDVIVYNFSSTSGGIPTAKYCALTALAGVWWVVSVEC